MNDQSSEQTHRTIIIEVGKVGADDTRLSYINTTAENSATSGVREVIAALSHISHIWIYDMSIFHHFYIALFYTL